MSRAMRSALLGLGVACLVMLGRGMALGQGMNLGQDMLSQGWLYLKEVVPGEVVVPHTTLHLAAVALRDVW